MNTCIIIPARFQSSRFPGKHLANILDKPMIIWVAELCSHAIGIENTFLATDHPLIEDVVSSLGTMLFLPILRVLLAQIVWQKPPCL